MIHYYQQGYCVKIQYPYKQRRGSVFVSGSNGLPMTTPIHVFLFSCLLTAKRVSIGNPNQQKIRAASYLSLIFFFGFCFLKKK